VTVHFLPLLVCAVSHNPVGKQHEEYQGFKIYGIQRIENFRIPTSRKSLTCFICDESKTYRKAIKIKIKKNKPVYTVEIWKNTQCM
jgi:hypothetical protein